MSEVAMIENTITWHPVCSLADIPERGARVVEHSPVNIALFKTSLQKVFALADECPHKKGPLSQGIVHGEAVTCPLHAWNISLVNGLAREPDVGCTASYPVRIEGETVYLGIKNSSSASA